MLKFVPSSYILKNGGRSLSISFEIPFSRYQVGTGSGLYELMGWLVFSSITSISISVVAKVNAVTSLSSVYPL